MIYIKEVMQIEMNEANDAHRSTTTLSAAGGKLKVMNKLIEIFLMPKK